MPARTLARTLAPVALLALLVAAPVAGAAQPSSASTTHRLADSATPSPSIPVPDCSARAGVGVPTAVRSLVPDGAGRNAPPADAAGVTRTAVVDRFEGDRAVLLVEARGEVVGRRVVRRTALPRAARHDDAVVTIAVVADAVAAVTYRPAETARRRQAIERRFDRLAVPAPGSRRPTVC